MPKHSKSFILLALMLLPLFTVVVSAEEPQPFPAGVYTITITADEVPVDAPPDVRKVLIAKYVVTYSANGRYKVLANGKLDAEGRYASTKNYLVITDEKGPGHCQAERATGVYKWRLDGNKLILEAVDDACKWRRFSIVLKAWRREK
jgi:hypothetical protein